MATPVSAAVVGAAGRWSCSGVHPAELCGRIETGRGGLRAGFGWAVDGHQWPAASPDDPELDKIWRGLRWVDLLCSWRDRHCRLRPCNETGTVRRRVQQKAEETASVQGNSRRRERTRYGTDPETQGPLAPAPQPVVRLIKSRRRCGNCQHPSTLTEL